MATPIRPPMPVRLNQRPETTQTQQDNVEITEIAEVAPSDTPDVVIDEAPLQDDLADINEDQPEVTPTAEEPKPKRGRPKAAPKSESPVVEDAEVASPAGDEPKAAPLQLSIAVDARVISPYEIAGFEKAVSLDDVDSQIEALLEECQVKNSRIDRTNGISQSVIDDVAERGQLLDPLRLYFNEATGKLEAFDSLTRILGIIRSIQSGSSAYESVSALVYTGEAKEIAYLEDSLNSMRANFTDAERILAIQQYLNAGGTPEDYLRLCGSDPKSNRYREIQTLVDVASHSYAAKPVVEGVLSLDAARKLMASSDSASERKERFKSAVAQMNAQLKEAKARRKAVQGQVKAGPKTSEEVSAKERKALERAVLQKEGAAGTRASGLSVSAQRRRLFETISDGIQSESYTTLLETIEAGTNESDYAGSLDLETHLFFVEVKTRLEILGALEDNSFAEALSSFIGSASPVERTTWLSELSA